MMLPFGLTGYRPVRTLAACRFLRDSQRKAQALNLLQTHFPHLVGQVKPTSGWVQVLRGFLSLVQDDEWFEIDWASVTSLEQWAQVDYEDGAFLDEPLASQHLARALKFIPIRYLGYNPDPEIRHPALDLLLCLLAPGSCWAAPDLLIPDWSDEDRSAAWKRLPYQVMSWSEPLCWLLEAAEYACGRTSNPLLDRRPPTAADVLDEILDEWWDISWSQEGIERLRGLWLEAQEILDVVVTFSDWAAASNDRLQLVADLVMGQQVESY